MSLNTAHQFKKVQTYRLECLWKYYLRIDIQLNSDYTKMSNSKQSHFIPQWVSGFYPDIALLLIRLWVGISLFVNHGMEKISHFSEMQKTFPDPVHIGKTPGLVFALITDAILPLFLALGLFSKISTFFLIINLLVAFIMVHGGSFASPPGEIDYLYLGVVIMIFISGPGKYSVDKFISSRR